MDNKNDRSFCDRCNKELLGWKDVIIIVPRYEDFVYRDSVVYCKSCYKKKEKDQ